MMETTIPTAIVESKPSTQYIAWTSVHARRLDAAGSEYLL